MAKAAGLITDNEQVNIHCQIMTAHEARASAYDHLSIAINENNYANYFFNIGDYETCFLKAKMAESETHLAKNIYEALLA
jgi:hypothetical protein